jgi:hypothetical protein
MCIIIEPEFFHMRYSTLRRVPAEGCCFSFRKNPIDLSVGPN